MAHDATSSHQAVKTCHGKIRLLVDGTDNNIKMFSDLRKGEVKNYTKTKDTFKGRIRKFYDTRYKIDSLERELIDYQNAINQNDISQAESKNRKEKSTTINQTLLKLKVDFDQMKVDAQDISEEFNKTKHKFVRVFNAYGENVENRVKDNLILFIQKVTDLSLVIKLNNSSIGDSTRPSSKDHLPGESSPHSRGSISEGSNICQVEFPSDFRVVFRDITYEKEQITDPDIYFKFMTASESDLNIIKEINMFASNIKPELAEDVISQASNVILGKTGVSSIVQTAGGSLETQTFGNRVAVFLLMLQPKLGKIADKETAETMRDQLLESLNIYMGSGDVKSVEDKQFMFYTLKLMEMTYFAERKFRNDLTGRRTARAWVIETIRESIHFEQFMKTSAVYDYSFWDLYYRHSNYFVEKNFYFFQHFKMKEEIRAFSLACLWEIWTCCVQKDYRLAFDHIIEIRKKFKLTREAPEYAMQLAEPKVCEILDSRADQEELNVHSPELWTRVTDFLTTEEKMTVAKTCRSLYHDLRLKAIGDQLISHPDLRNRDAPIRETLWLAMIPKVV